MTLIADRPTPLSQPYVTTKGKAHCWDRAAQLPIPALPTGVCIRPVLIARRDTEAEAFTADVECGGNWWPCADHGPELKGKHLGQLQLEGGDVYAADGAMYLIEVEHTDTDWDRVRKEQYRLGVAGRYVRFDFGDTVPYLLLTAAPVAGARRLTFVEYQEVLAQAMAALPFDRRRISVGKAWRLPTEAFDSYELEGSKYMHLSSLPKPTEEEPDSKRACKARLETIGIPCDYDGSKLRFTIPPPFVEAGAARTLFLAYLGGDDPRPPRELWSLLRRSS